jgi:hypothetical protein
MGDDPGRLWAASSPANPTGSIRRSGVAGVDAKTPEGQGEEPAQVRADEREGNTMPRHLVLSTRSPA